MTNEIKDLITQMEKQRFLPITEDTPKLYESCRASIDPHDPDDLACLLFFEGEYFYRIGNLGQCLNLLDRCLQAPKAVSLRYLDALSYNIIGLTYSYLGQETIAINYLLLAKSISEELSLARETAVCYTNLGIVYGQLEDFETALSYHEQALDHLTGIPTGDSYNLKVLCHAYRGILYCKNGQYEKANEVVRVIEALRQENNNLFYDASVLDLKVLLYETHHDQDILSEDLGQMLKLSTSITDFLEFAEFYFDVCDYFLRKGMKEECSLTLNYIEHYTSASQLIFLQYQFLQRKAAYANAFLSRDEHESACSELISLRPAYIEEQSSAKLQSLEYAERVRQTKNDSQMYLEKSRIDIMTGLLNKHTVQFLVEEDLSKLTPERQVAMLLVDLDHFKQINDTFGYLMGDTLISQTGSVIQNYFKDNVLCGRIGGDEFLIYINDATDNAFILLQAEALRQEIHRQTSTGNIQITTQASIGIAFSSEFCYDYESLFSAADSALYRAKLEGRGKVVVA